MRPFPCGVPSRRAASASTGSTRTCSPPEVQLSLDEAGDGRLSGPDGVLELSELTAIWYRRNATGSGIPRDMDQQLRKPSVEESRRLVFGMLTALGVFQLDPLEVVRRAEHKPLQLKLARALGLEVPRTLMTNDPEAVRAFAASCPGGRGDEDDVVLRRLRRAGPGAGGLHHAAGGAASWRTWRAWTCAR